MTNDASMRITATLLRDGYIRRRDAEELLDEDVQAQVRERLDHVGLDLLLSVHSDAWGIIIRDDLVRQTGGEWITNEKGLRRNTIALIVILWKELILPSRLASSADAVVEGQRTLDGNRVQEDQKPAATSLDKLFSDYGKRFGPKQTLQSLLTYLKRHNIIEYENQNEIRAGPLLDILLPGPQMKHFVESEIMNLLNKENGNEGGA